MNIGIPSLPLPSTVGAPQDSGPAGTGNFGSEKIALGPCTPALAIVANPDKKLPAAMHNTVVLSGIRITHKPDSAMLPLMAMLTVPELYELPPLLLLEGITRILPGDAWRR